MKKMKYIVAMLTMSAMLLVGCGGGNNAAAPDAEKAEADKTETAISYEATVQDDGSFDRVKEAGKITVGLDDAYPPMGYRDTETNEIIGFDIDMANAISEKLGVPFEFVPADWNAIVPSLQTEKFDVIISGMNMWDERIAEINFVPYGEAGQYVLVRKDAGITEDITSLDYFEERKIGTQLGSTAAKELMAAGFTEGTNLTLYKTFPEITVDLDNGRIDALAIDSFGSSELLKSGEYDKVLELEQGADVEEGSSAALIGIGIRKTDGDLQLALQKAVDELLVDGTLAELSIKWIGSDITEPLVADAQARLDAAE